MYSELELGGLDSSSKVTLPSSGWSLDHALEAICQEQHRRGRTEIV